MPQEPKKRHSRARQGKRRVSIFFTAPKGITCKNCTSIILPHTVCVKCGFYEGRKIIDIKNKLAKTA